MVLLGCLLAEIADLLVEALKSAAQRLQFTPEIPALLHQRLHVMVSPFGEILGSCRAGLAAALTPGLHLFRQG